MLEQSTPSRIGESGAPPEDFEKQGSWKFIPVHFAFITDFVEGDDDALLTRVSVEKLCKISCFQNFSS